MSNYQIVGTDSQSSGFSDWTTDNHHRSGISDDRTTNTDWQNDVLGYWTSSTGCGAAPLTIGQPTPIANAASLSIKSPALTIGEGSPTTASVARARFPNIESLTPVAKRSHRPLDRRHWSRSKVTRPMAMVAKAESPVTGTVAYQPDGGGEATEWFQKMFYQIFRDKIFYNLL